MSDERQVYDTLDALGIPFTRHEHPPVFTVEEAEPHWRDIRATHCKNLFLRNGKGSRHYLVILEHSKSANLKDLAARVGDDRLGFASPDRLQRYLGLTPGSVSPFGLIHPAARDVIVVLDADLAGAERLGFHPNVNTATITLAAADFLRASAASAASSAFFGSIPSASERSFAADWKRPSAKAAFPRWTSSCTRATLATSGFCRAIRARRSSARRSSSSRRASRRANSVAGAVFRAYAARLASSASSSRAWVMRRNTRSSRPRKLPSRLPA